MARNRVHAKIAWALCALGVGISWSPVGVRPARADETPGGAVFLVLKTGERDATQKKAGQFLADLGHYLGPALGLAKLDGLIFNKPDEAMKAAEGQHPVFGIVTPAFFFEHEEKLGLVAVAASRRNGKDGEVYALVGKKGGPAPAAGQSVATTITAEKKYVEQVIWPGFAGKPIPAPALKPVKNLADAVFDMTEGGADAPVAVLLDRASLDFFQSDAQTWPKLEVLATSKTLPADLVVVFGGAASADRAGKLWGGLEKILGDENGKKICKNLQTEGFAKVDPQSLEEARKLYGGK